MPTVSVIIPTLRRPVLLERALRSVLGQTFRHYEIIVVIDGPDTETDPAAITALDERIRVLSLPSNVGLAEARNVGIRHAQGRYIALLDDDDEWLPRKLEYQSAKAFELNGDYVFVPCKFFERTAHLERIMPERLPSAAANFSEYIYCDQG